MVECSSIVLQWLGLWTKSHKAGDLTCRRVVCFDKKLHFTLFVSTKVNANWVPVSFCKGLVSHPERDGAS